VSCDVYVCLWERRALHRFVWCFCVLCHMWISTTEHTHTRTPSVTPHTPLHTPTHSYTLLHTYTPLHTHTHTHTHTHIYIYIYIYIYIRHRPLNTHTHTRTPSASLRPRSNMERTACGANSPVYIWICIYMCVSVVHNKATIHPPTHPLNLKSIDPPPHRPIHQANIQF
jgi:hypothetical protein